MKRKSIFKLSCLALAVGSVLSACSDSAVDVPATQSQSEVTQSVVSDSIAQNPDSPLANINVEYSQAVSTVYTVDGVDFVATTNGIGVVEPGKEMRMLNNQKTSPRLMIIDNVIYYTVVNNVYETPAEDVEGDPMPILFAQCDCWSMNLDGTDQKKLFSYFGNGWVAYRQDNTVFYIDETTFDEFKNEDADVLKLCKIDLITGKTQTITYLRSDSAGNTIWGTMDTDYYTIYKDGYIIITSRSQEAGSYIYNIEANVLQEQDIHTLMLANDGALYGINYVETPIEDGDYTYIQHLVKYNIKNNSTEPTGIKTAEYRQGEITYDAYGDNGIIFGYDTLYIYTPESLGLIKASDTRESHIDDVWVNTDKSYSYISSIYNDSDVYSTYYLTNHVNPETSDTVELKDIQDLILEWYYHEVKIGANIVIGYYYYETRDYKTNPANVFCTDYTVVYR